jgi:hypothetical protein
MVEANIVAAVKARAIEAKASRDHADELLHVDGQAARDAWVAAETIRFTDEIQIQAQESEVGLNFTQAMVDEFTAWVLGFLND